MLAITTTKLNQSTIIISIINFLSLLYEFQAPELIQYFGVHDPKQFLQDAPSSSFAKLFYSFEL